MNTHHHFDHAGGLRTYVAQSTTVVTHQGNRDFYDDVFFHPGRRILEPDILSGRMPWFSGNRIPAFETVNEKYVLSDGERTMDIYPVLGLAHNGNMLIAYLPTERILINADLYSPPAPGAQLPSANASMRSLSQNIERHRSCSQSRSDPDRQGDHAHSQVKENSADRPQDDGLESCRKRCMLGVGQPDSA